MVVGNGLLELVTDAQPYFRIFNPWTQSEKFDSECKYIKKWLPVLEDIPNKEIHKWYKFSSNYKIDYPEPIVDHSIERVKTIKMFKNICLEINSNQRFYIF